MLLPRRQRGRPTDMFEVFRRYPRIMMIGTCDWSVANGAAFISLPSIVKQTRAMRRDTSCHGDCSEANNTSMCMLHMCIDIFPSDRRKASLLKAARPPISRQVPKKEGQCKKLDNSLLEISYAGFVSPTPRWRIDKHVSPPSSHWQ